MPHDQTMPPIPDHKDFIYEVCHYRAQMLNVTVPAPSSLDTATLLWDYAMCSSYAVELASCVFSAHHPSEPRRVTKLVGNVMVNDTPATLHELWRAWVEQHHTDRGFDCLIWMPSYFLSFQIRRISILRELGRRGRQLNVYRAFAGLTAGPVQPDMVRLRRLLGAINTTLKTTVGRKLNLTDVVYDKLPSDHEDKEGPKFIASGLTNEESIAIDGALAKKNRMEKVLFENLNEGSILFPGSEQSIKDILFPKLSVPGMEDPDGLNRGWRDASIELALSVLASIAPGHLGWFETALSDAAHASQRDDRRKIKTKSRGGAGEEKDKKTWTNKLADEYDPMCKRPKDDAGKHVPIGYSTEDDLANGFVYIDPGDEGDDRPNQEQDLEAHEEEEKVLEDAGRALRIAFDHGGSSWQHMLEAIKDGKTYNEAAKAAGISPPAVTKRLKTLKKLLDQ